jgi:hypothetical protein
MLPGESIVPPLCSKGNTVTPPTFVHLLSSGHGHSTVHGVQQNWAHHLKMVENYKEIVDFICTYQCFSAERDARIILPGPLSSAAKFTNQVDLNKNCYNI